MSAAFSKCLQFFFLNAPAQGSLKFREVSNSFWEGTRREKTRLKKVSYLLTCLLTYLLSQLVSQTKTCTFTCDAFHKFLEVQV